MLGQLLLIGGAWQLGLALTLLLAPDVAYSSAGYEVIFALSPRWVHGVAWLVGAVLSFIAWRRPALREWALTWATGTSASWALGMLAGVGLGTSTGWSGAVTYTAVAAFWAATLARGED